MSKIKILSENLANQIAAGEVIERPASIVKEFIENSIDAGAREIAVHVEGNGSRLIRVIDDGEGMDEDDVLLCLERHATSKIAGEDRLGEIRTLGFRGEAIPSIASVSRLTITSRPASADLGTQAAVRYGRVMKVHEMGCGIGTTMEVKDLFGNVPARRKFLKSARTELFHIEETVSNYALAYHQLGIIYSTDGRVVLRLPAGSDSLESRVKQLLGKRVTRPPIPVESIEASGATDNYVAITGCLLPFEQATGSAARLRLFVNGRAVRDRMITHAVSEGLRGFLMKGQRPAGVIFLTVSPNAVDVNVHPTKQEIRFHKTDLIHGKVVQAVSRSVAQHENRLKRSVFVLPEKDKHEPCHKSEAGIERSEWPQPFAMPTTVHEPQPMWQDAGTSNSSVDKSFQSQGGSRALSLENSADTAGIPVPEPVIPRAAEIFDEKQEGEPAEDAELGSSQGSYLKLIGQLSNSYLLCEAENGLIAIDQHAAHERLIFESLRKQFGARSVASQALLFPKVIDCSLAESNVLKKHGDDIARMGIDIHEFGSGSYVIKAVPAIMADTPPEEIMAGIFSQYIDSDSRRNDSCTRIESILATIACKAAVKAGHPLQPAEMRRLLLRMQETDIFSHCPHGRPVYKYFSPDDIKKWFCRT